MAAGHSGVHAEIDQLTAGHRRVHEEIDKPAGDHGVHAEMIGRRQ